MEKNPIKQMEKKELEELYDKDNKLNSTEEQELLKKFISHIEDTVTVEGLSLIFQEKNYKNIFEKYIKKLFK